jgi:formylmethanofuran dehydrogenase subunit B
MVILKTLRQAGLFVHSTGARIGRERPRVDLRRGGMVQAAAMDAALSLRVPFCGLPCPEVRLAPGAPGGERVSGGCPTCRAEAMRAVPDVARPAVGGQPASETQALDAAAALLLEARSPFVFGLSMSSCGTARRAASIARRLRGAIDVEGAAALESDLQALRAFGLAAATFGEVHRRADVVLLWRCDPRLDHPDLIPARLPGDGSAARLFLLVPPPGEIAGAGARALAVAEGGDLEAILVLRVLLSGREPAGVAPGRGATVVAGGRFALADLIEAASALRRARYPVIVWDAAATRGPGGAVVAYALTLLARDLNERQRAAARPLGAGGNVAGAMASILSECGHPRAVGFAGDGPREAPEVFGAGPMLAGGADALLLVGARVVVPPRHGPPPRAVVVGPWRPEGCAEPEVFIPTAVPALSEKGLWLRADGAAVPLRAPRPSSQPTERDVLDRLIARLAEAPSRPKPGRR